MEIVRVSHQNLNCWDFEVRWSLVKKFKKQKGLTFDLRHRLEGEHDLTTFIGPICGTVSKDTRGRHATTEKVAPSFEFEHLQREGTVLDFTSGKKRKLCTRFKYLGNQKSSISIFSHGDST